MRIILPMASLAFLVFAALHVAQSDYRGESVEPAAPPPRSPFESALAGAGIVESLTENIEVASPLPGVAVEVFVRPGDIVQPGERLFRLDDRRLLAELRVRQAELALAKSELARLKAQPRQEEIPPAEATVRSAEAALHEFQDRLERVESLGKSRSVSEEAIVSARQKVLGAEASLARAKAELELLKAGAWAPDVLRGEAAVVHAEQQVESVKTDIDRLTVQAVLHGEVLQVNVRPGEFVSTPSSKPPVLMGCLDQLHVRVDIDESEIPRFNANAPAVGMVKGRPGLRFPLTFERVEPYVAPKRSLTGANDERVDTRVLQVIYAIETSASKAPLYVGQRMDVFIDTINDKLEEGVAAPSGTGGKRDLARNSLSLPTN